MGRGMRALGLGLSAAVLVLAGCGGGGAAEEPAASGSASEPAELTPVKLQLQWVAQAQFAGYYAAVEQATTRGVSTSRSSKVGRTSCRRTCCRPATSTSDLLGAQGARLDRAGREDHRRGADLRAQRDDADLVQGQEHTDPAQLAGKNIGSWGFGNEWELFAGMQKSGVEVKDIKLITQAFDMNGFLAGDIDAAQAMTYNEYAQVLESKNPATGELFKPEDLNVIDWNEVGTAMLQDAIWANSDKLSDPAYADQTTKLIKASIKGWVYARDNPEEAAKIVAGAGSTWWSISCGDHASS